MFPWQFVHASSDALRLRDVRDALKTLNLFVWYFDCLHSLRWTWWVIGTTPHTCNTHNPQCSHVVARSAHTWWPAVLIRDGSQCSHVVARSWRDVTCTTCTAFTSRSIHASEILWDDVHVRCGCAQVPKSHRGIKGGGGFVFLLYSFYIIHSFCTRSAG